jgi:hypothetical protein
MMLTQHILRRSLLFAAAGVLLAVVGALPAFVQAQAPAYTLEPTVQFNTPEVRTILPGDDDTIPTQGFTLTYDQSAEVDLDVSKITIAYTQVSGDAGALEVQEAPLRIDGIQYDATVITDTSIEYNFTDLIIFPGEVKEFLLELNVRPTTDQKEAIAFFTTVSAATITANESGSGILRGAIHNVLTNNETTPYDGGYPVADEPPVDDEPVDDEEPPAEEEPGQTPEDGVVMSQEGTVVTLTYVAPSTCYRYFVNWGDRNRDYERELVRPCQDTWTTISVTHTYDQPGTYRLSGLFDRERIRETVTITDSDDDENDGDSLTAQDVRFVIGRLIDPDRRVADDEYIRYVLFLKDGGRPIVVNGCPGDCSDEATAEPFREVGYVGGVESLLDDALILGKRGIIRGASVTGYETLVLDIMQRASELTGAQATES